MTVDSLQREADFRKNVAANPDYAKSPEGRKARAELVGDRKALAAMQKETGVNNKIVDGNIKKKSKVKKAVQRAKIGLRAAGKTVNDQKKKVVNKVKQAHRKTCKNKTKSEYQRVFQPENAAEKRVPSKSSDADTAARKYHGQCGAAKTKRGKVIFSLKERELAAPFLFDICPNSFIFYT